MWVGGGMGRGGEWLAQTVLVKSGKGYRAFIAFQQWSGAFEPVSFEKPLFRLLISGISPPESGDRADNLHIAYTSGDTLWQVGEVSAALAISQPITDHQLVCSSVQLHQEIFSLPHSWNLPPPRPHHFHQAHTTSSSRRFALTRHQHANPTPATEDSLGIIKLPKIPDQPPRTFNYALLIR